MDRYRSRNHVQLFPISHITGSGVVTNGIISGTALEECWDTVTPGYFALKREGKVLPVNPFRKRGKKVVESTSHPNPLRDVYLYYPGTRDPCTYAGSILNFETYGHIALGLLGQLRGSIYPSASLPPIDGLGVATADQLTPEALAEARLKNMDALTMVAELHKTKDLLVGARDRVLQRATRITKALHRKGVLDAIVPRSAKFGAVLAAMKRRQNGRVRQKILDVFTEVWMEHRYGWRITIYEIEDLMETWLKYRLEVGPLVKGKADDSSESEVSTLAGTATTVYIPGVGSKVVGLVNYDSESRLVASRKVGLGYEYAFNTLLTVDPLVTSLELIPFGWIADWFTNLGDIVRGYSPFGLGSILWYYTTAEVKREYTLSYTPYGVTGNKTKKSCTSGPAGTCRTEYYDRTRTPLVWNDHRPSVRLFNNLDWPKALDALSVLRGLGDPLKPWIR